MIDWQKTTVGKVATGFLSGGTPTTSTEMESTDNRPTIFANRLIPLAQTTESSCLHQIQNQQTEIGVYPVDWIVDRVDSAFDIQQGKQVSKRNRDGEHQRPFLRTKNVFWNRLELTKATCTNIPLPTALRMAPPCRSTTSLLPIICSSRSRRWMRSFFPLPKPRGWPTSRS